MYGKIKTTSKHIHFDLTQRQQHGEIHRQGYKYSRQLSNTLEEKEINFQCRRIDLKRMLSQYPELKKELFLNYARNSNVLKKSIKKSKKIMRISTKVALNALTETAVKELDSIILNPSMPLDIKTREVFEEIYETASKLIMKKHQKHLIQELTLETKKRIFEELKGIEYQKDFFDFCIEKTVDEIISSENYEIGGDFKLMRFEVNKIFNRYNQMLEIRLNLFKEHRAQAIEFFQKNPFITEEMKRIISEETNRNDFSLPQMIDWFVKKIKPEKINAIE
ncbi:MAG: hypothetical protein JW703_00540, partial [Candidatus Diapherotrites archaeon]|nr:hypothetical protein [Candidatus Diapherotrites archaeon]